MHSLYHPCLKATFTIPHTHALVNIGWRHAIPKADNELGYLLDVDHIHGLFVLTAVNDFGASRHLDAATSNQQNVTQPDAKPINLKAPGNGRHQPALIYL